SFFFTHDNHPPLGKLSHDLELIKMWVGVDAYFKDEYPLDIAVATNMIQVGMDVDRLGLMAVTGQPKTTAEYIQATSRIGRQTPGLVVTIYNPYRARDLSHYENFTAYHAHLYRFVEGTSATPFSARARERALHASLIGMLRGMIDELRSTKEGARKIEQINQDDIQMIIDMILNRIKIVDPNSVEKAEDDIRYFLDEWIKLSRTEKNLYYNVHHNNQGYKMNRVQRLLKAYGSYGKFNYEKETLNSMRNVQKESGLYLWED
ncbi:Helicase conserved C-terminal domain-containing protein, partial [Anaerovirgula multivorans]